MPDLQSAPRVLVMRYWTYGSYLWSLIAAPADLLGGLTLVRLLTACLGSSPKSSVDSSRSATLARSRADIPFTPGEQAACPAPGAPATRRRGPGRGALPSRRAHARRSGGRLG